MIGGGTFPGDGSAAHLLPIATRRPHSTTVVHNTTTAAFFDLDKTIIARSSAHAFSRQFMESGLLTTTGVLNMTFGHIMYVAGGHDSDQMAAARDQLASMVAGWRAADVRAIAEQSLHEVISPHVYTEAINLIAHHQRLGHDVVVISASAREVVEPIAATLGITDVIATDLAVADGRYTGEVQFFCSGPHKATAVRELADARGYDLSRCYAYSDSATDEPMLSAVGHPVAVNPDRALRKIAAERKWPIREFLTPEPLFASTQQAVGFAAGGVVGAALLAAAAVAVLRYLRR
ncbi:HAD-IB family hydrolase [Corynebacterium sp. TAE3-ERU12]|uniref:HAD family hydrolase n=1 Tax=Corynebacterium sp. TAE3-ERU12 TaxID=2849491 RepID=UPI001C4870E9|nr:HAD-IB family hydrolase [Corynebacterium sp. TAE3-ERU12]